jgi:hypothetical protein
MDVNLPGMTDIEYARRLKKLFKKLAQDARSGEIDAGWLVAGKIGSRYFHLIRMAPGARGR